MAVVACKKPFVDDDQLLVRLICGKISREIGNNEYYLNYGQTYLENMIIRLIEDDFEDRRLYSDHIANVYRGFKEYIYVAAAGTAGQEPAEKLRYIKDLMKQREPNFKYTIYHGHIVILFSSNYKTFLAGREWHILYNLFEQENLYAGISTSFENIYEMPKCYAQAVAALNEQKSDGDGRYTVYSRAKLFPLLNQ